MAIQLHMQHMSLLQGYSSCIEHLHAYLSVGFPKFMKFKIYVILLEAIVSVNDDKFAGITKNLMVLSRTEYVEEYTVC